MYVCGLSLNDKNELKCHNARGTTECCSESESLEHKKGIKASYEHGMSQIQAMDLLATKRELPGYLMKSVVCLDTIYI